MKADEVLRVFALGPVQVFRGKEPVTQWSYVESEELLFYLLCHTVVPRGEQEHATVDAEALRGKTKEQIGLDLWPDVTPDQLNSKLKSRLYDLRHALGRSEWIIFDDGQYKFNFALAHWFDVRVFEDQVAEAEHLEARSPAQAIAIYQEAIQLYRGDFLEDLRKGRVRKEYRYPGEDAEREWYLPTREALRAKYQKSLHHMGQLLTAAHNHEQAAQVYGMAAAKDVYDDEAHYGLMRSFALQGKRSQALQHYRKLVKERMDTPPEPEIVKLAERLKRGEELAPRATAPGLATEPDQKPAAPFQAPPELSRFVGREAELRQCRIKLTQPNAGKLYSLAGMGGVGKTSLAIHLAHGLRDHFRDGVLWAHASTSEPLAILDSWARAYHYDFSGLPDLESRAVALRGVLADKRALMILDDVRSAERMGSLRVGGPECAVLFTSRDLDVAAALDAEVIAVPVLAADESLELFSRIVGEARVEAEKTFADEICGLLGYLPLALDIAAHRLASRPRWTLREMAERLRVQYRRLGELQIADRQVRASFAISWEALDENLRRIFALLGVFEGRAFTAAALAAVAQVDDRTAADHLDSLVALSLLSTEGDIHYRQHPLLADYAREKLAERETPEAAAHPERAQAAEARMAQYYLRYATEQRHNYLALEAEWDNLTAGIEIAHAQQLWQVVIDYGDVLTDAWFARGRFSDARRAYPRVMHAARELEEQDPYIAAGLNWGKACIDQGDYDEAEEHLRHGLQTSREVSDEHGIASALFLLGRVSVERSEYDAAQQYLEESQQLREKLNDRAGVAETLYMQARIQSRLDDDEAAVRIGKKALEIYGTLPHSHAYLVTLRLVAEASSYVNQLEAAEQYMNMVFALCDELQDESEKGVALYNMSIVLRRRGEFRQALRRAEEGLALLQRMGDRKTASNTLNQISRIAADINDIDSALHYALESLRIYQDLRDGLGQISISLHLGDLFKQIGEFERACETWFDALRLAERLKHPNARTLRERLDQNCSKSDLQKTIDMLS